MTRPTDTVSIQSVGGKVFDRFTSVEITNDLTAPSEASIECGDDGTWEELESYIALGKPFAVSANGRLRLTGRIEAVDAPVDPASGACVRFLIRTKLSDAAFASADPKISIQGATLKQVVLKAYLSLGYTEKDFVFKANLARDLQTGKPSKGAQTKETKLEPLKLEQARVNPPETIFEFVERHLQRFHLSHWDSPDGKIVVGAPNDGQAPLYRFLCKRGASGVDNNVESVRRLRDASDTPSVVGVFSGYRASDFQTAKIGRSKAVADIVAAHMYRPILFVDSNIQTIAQAEAKVMREVVNRIKKLDAWEVHTDGWSFWDGHTAIPYGVDTVADVDVDVAGGTTGAYLVHRVRSILNAQTGYTSDLTMVRKGLWVL